MTVTCCSLLLTCCSLLLCRSLLLLFVPLCVILVPLLFTLVLFICASPKPTYGVDAYPQPNPRVIGAA